MPRELTITSPNWSPRPNGLADVWGALVHWTATPKSVSAEDVARFFRNPASKVSSHVVIDRDGTIVHCVPIARAAWHAGAGRFDFDHDGRIESWQGETSINTHTGGIEFCHAGPGGTWPDPQIRSGAIMLRRWDAQCPNFKLRSITDHEQVSLSGKIDVDGSFPAARLFWYIIHPRTSPPANVYSALPSWARKQVDQIKK